MAVRVQQHSRLRFHRLLSVEGFEFWDHAVLPEIPAQQDDLTHLVSQGDRLDLLASRYYGDPTLWWVIAVANGLDLPQVDLNVGDSIRIPSPRYVRQELFKNARGV